jgi:hypothetical protein
MKMAAVLLCVAGFATAAVATPEPAKTYMGTGGALNDAGASPTANVFTITVPIADEAEIFSMIDLTLDITHTFVGDLTVTLTHPSGAVATIFDRPGVPPGTFGNGDNLDGVYIFEDFQPQLPEATGAPNGIIAPGTYGTSGPGNLFDFDGLMKAGVWTLTITDSAGGDSGTLRGWSITMNNVPAPSALALLGLGGLAAARRRR